MPSPAYWAQMVAKLENPARAEYAAHVLATGLPGRLVESNLGPAIDSVGVSRVVTALRSAVTLDEDAFPYVVQALTALPPADVLAAYRTLPSASASAKEALRTVFQDTAPRFANEVI